MTIRARWFGPIVGTACLLGILALTLAPYGGNPSALFHYGTDIETTTLPTGFVVLDAPSYDGAHYYRIAAGLAGQTRSYAYQRILLPVLARALSLGNVAQLAWAFLAINLFALLATGVVLAKRGHHAITVLALMLCPAALLGLHFSLAEPLTILLLTAFIVRAQEWARFDLLGAILLSLAVLTREVNILFIGVVGIWLVSHRRWKDVLWLAIPIATFAAWHGAIFAMFGDWPFFMSAEKHGWPLVAVWEIVSGTKGYDAYTLSSIALLLLFVLPMLAWSIGRIVKGDRSLPTCGALAFLILMLVMPDHIWGSITSIGRVITPVYPCAVLALAARDTRTARILLSGIILLGLAVGFALALNVHPFHLS